MRERKQEVERLLFAIAVHGPDAIFDHLDLYRLLHKQDREAFEEVSCALMSAGMERADAMDLVGGKHDQDCACWRCVLRLQVDVMRHREGMRMADEMDLKLEAAE